MRAILQKDEPEAVYRELVEGLSENAVPMLLLLVLLLATGTFVLSVVHDTWVLAATGASALSALVKTGVIVQHQRNRAVCRVAPLARVRRYEQVHGVSTIALSLSVGLFAMSVYRLSQAPLDLLPMCLSFGYSGGLISRVSIRPRIATGAILALGVPNALGMALSAMPAYLVVAGVVLFFMVAALQSVAFVYEASRRSVALRLQLETLARRDALTGLLNRFGLSEAFSALPDDRDRTMAVHAFDLDGFKRINDEFGHAAGDRVLAGMAERIRSIAPPGTIAARIGGDEFVLVQTGIGGEADARELAERLHHGLTPPIDIGSRMARVGLSLGYSVGPLRTAGFEELLHRADEASFAVKRAGGGIRSSLEPPASLLAVSA